MEKIILASASPRRKQIMEMMGVKYETISPNYDEDNSVNLTPKETVMLFAREKAMNVAKRSDGIVIGADTIIFFKDKKIGKPKDKEEAFRILKMLSGKMHEVYSGISIINTKTGEEINDFEITEVKFKELSDEEIIKYIETNEPMDKSGSYAIQGYASVFVEKINGCYYNVMGLPVNKLVSNLNKLGVAVCDYWKKGL
ncbi:MAG: Maf family protein [Nanoarchaeota archaeon]|nr:Maf family protein [Nanoarchaeota archaeon]